MLEFHPLANVLPLLEGVELDRLVADIAEHGLLNPITLYEGKILDGRNRERACHAASVKPRYEQFTGKDPAAFVLSQNLARRHLGPSERAMVAARIATLADGQRQVGKFAYVPTQEQAAQLAGVSERSVKSARVVLEQGAPELVQAVERGRMAVHEAASIAKKSEDEQRAIIEKVSDGMKPQEARRAVKVDAIAARKPGEFVGKYRVLYADPPWKYGNTQVEGFREQRDHYPVMDMAGICALPVGDLAEDDAVLFLWVTSPILEESFQVINAWGFKYKAAFIWDKVKHVMGHYNSVRHELLLIAVRGSCQPDNRKLFDSVQKIERTEHSVKPKEFYEIIEALYPHGRRIELFARHARPGWDCWGNEALPF